MAGTPANGASSRPSRAWWPSTTPTRPKDRRYALLPGSAAVLLDPESPAYLIPIGGFLEAVGRVLPALEAAFRTGGGVSYAEYAVQHAQGGFNRPAYLGQLVQDWMPQVPDLDARLRRAAPSPSSAAARAGRRSRSRSATRGCGSTRSTWTRPPSRRRGATPRPQGWLIASGSPSPTSPTPR